MLRALQIAGWIVCGIYATIPAFWLLIHPFADFWRRRYRAPLKILGFVWIALWVIAWAVSAPWRFASIPISPWWALLTIPLWAASLFIYFGGQRHFSISQVIGRNELESDRQPQILVTTGLHARMRHPLYFGHLCTLFGWLAIARTEAIAGLLIVAVISGAFMIRTEDAELEARFGHPYSDYRRKVPAVLPRF